MSQKLAGVGHARGTVVAASSTDIPRSSCPPQRWVPEGWKMPWSLAGEIWQAPRCRVGWCTLWHPEPKPVWRKGGFALLGGPEASGGSRRLL